MSDKSLADKAVNIKGKQYVLVQDRVLYFNENYPKGCIYTDAHFYPEIKAWVVIASVWPEGQTIGTRKFTGHSQAVIGEGMVNKTAALENAETSAVGRALAFMGIGVIDSVASADEMHKATAPQRPPIASQTKETAPKVDKDLVASKLRIAWLVGKLTGQKPPKDAAKWYGDKVFELTGQSLPLAGSVEELDEIAEALADLEIEK